jgi:L-alanine-DL-glutamate epimerase-like enolase superfamily enzyme
MARISAVETLRHPAHPMLLWVRIASDAGPIGLGETFHAPEAVAAIIHGTLAEILLGQDPTRIELLWHHMFKALHYAGHAGAEMRAISAIDIALWDLLGKLTEQPVYVLLGGACRERIPTYNTCAGYAGYPDHERSHEEPGELARDLLGSGIRAMKIWPFDSQAVASLGQRITPEQLEYGVSRFRAIRAAVGEEMDVALEGHCQWNLPSAIRIARAVEPYRPMWLEELMPPDNAKATRALREATSIPIVTSERLITRFGFRGVVEEMAAAIVMFDIGWTGGLTESKKIAALAATYQLPIAPHNPGGPVSHLVAAHFCASVYNLFLMESVRAFYLTWFPDVLTHNLVAERGEFPLPTGPGLGTELRAEFLADSAMVRQTSTQAASALTGYAVGDPYRDGDPWKSRRHSTPAGA